MNEEAVKKLAELHQEIENLKRELQQKEERINALLGYLKNSHVDPDFLAA